MRPAFGRIHCSSLHLLSYEARRHYVDGRGRHQQQKSKASVTEFIQVMTTTDTRPRAEAIARSLVERRLAACVQIVGPVLQKKRCEQQQDLRLPFAEIPRHVDEHADVSLLAAHDHGRRMLAGAGQPGAVARALNLHQALGSAADRTNLFVERRTATALPPETA